MTTVPRYGFAHRQVRALDFGHVVVLIDYRTGRVQCLLPAAASRWHEAARTGTTEPLGDTLARQLFAATLLVPAPAPAPWPRPRAARTAAASWGSAEHAAGTTRPHQMPAAAVLGAGAALASVFAAKHAGSPARAMHRVTEAVRLAASTVRRDATPAEAHAAVAAIRRAAWYSPGRTACLEQSAAAVLLLAGRRRGITWCHGVAADPVRLHAWVQTGDGTAVSEPDSTAAYTPALTIGGRHQQQP
ncbi:lasso peptide biosynthesis B2 protein [Kitasatospora sp. NPDC101176]|uniref:lasso peptide biosynthesis B2 protein n=1 Tax=Kitasatospora sp. NPDC101176 TaxID=3364099 RepID=UPI0038284285